ncbi:MAG TPA: polyribonucleotide nucleotidyltransferase [Salinivirgaceae bacterium]|nr:polyribonucleotide nucleotidyltransferase [Salinivirgaceae bacterium]
MNILQKSIILPDGREVILETGKLAKQADGAVVLKVGKTMLLATVVSATEAKEDVDFMPLSVEYREKFSAVGRFPGGFLRREGRPGDSEILVARLVDRALRPLFPDDYHAETFVNIELISAEKDVLPDAFAGLAASAAIAVSNIPFHGPISECRVARIDGKFVINPNLPELENADIDLMVGATYDNIMMVEGEMKEVDEADMLQALKIAHEEIKKHCLVQIEMAKELGVVKREYCHEVNDLELKEKIFAECYQKIYDIAKVGNPSKKERSEAFEAVKKEFLAQFTEDAEINQTLVNRYFHDVQKKAVRDCILKERRRLDGRKLDEIRPIWGEVDYLPSAHGSSIFTRGETQSLTTVTLGTKLDNKLIDEVTRQGVDKFLLHYNFPPYSTGEAKPYKGVGRREIGHGNLAYRALKPMIPNEDFPYTLRVVSDILESNGSSSMATVCAGTMALMDAGVKIKRPVSGIAMGLITDGEKYAVLSDILGDEDHLGDMDFKVAGTVNGVTATQMDIKIDGLRYDILEEALAQAKRGRLHILQKMLEVIPQPRETFKPHTPRIVQMMVPKDSIGAIIGTGGKVIQELQRLTNTIITIEEIDSVGVVEVAAFNEADLEQAILRIKEIAGIPEIGKVYKGKVKSIQSYGAFVEIMPNRDGLLHISEIEWRRLNKVEEVLKVGDTIEVKLLDIDENGKLKLSRKVLLPKPADK